MSHVFLKTCKVATIKVELVFHLTCYQEEKKNDSVLLFPGMKSRRGTNARDPKI